MIHKKQINATFKIRDECDDRYGENILDTLHRLKKSFIGHIDIDWEEIELKTKQEVKA